MSLKCKVQISLNNLESKKVIRTIKQSLAPDNIDFPDTLSLEIQEEKNSLVFTFYDTGNIRTLISTIDEVLEHIQVVMKVTK